MDTMTLFCDEMFNDCDGSKCLMTNGSKYLITVMDLTN